MRKAAVQKLHGGLLWEPRGAPKGAPRGFPLIYPFSYSPFRYFAA